MLQDLSPEPKTLYVFQVTLLLNTLSSMKRRHVKAILAIKLANAVWSLRSQLLFGNGKFFSVGGYCLNDKDIGEITGEIDTKRCI